MQIIINNVYTAPNIFYNNRDDNNNVLATRIFSDCYSAYKESDFNRKGFILQKINHSISFGYCPLNKNSLEGVWSKIKLLKSSFNGLNGNIFNSNRDINDTNYFNVQICTGLFYMRYKHYKLGLTAKRKEIIKFLKCN